MPVTPIRITVTVKKMAVRSPRMPGWHEKMPVTAIRTAIPPIRPAASPDAAPSIPAFLGKPLPHLTDRLSWNGGQAAATGASYIGPLIHDLAHAPVFP